jgi:hypothetical protein
MKEIDKKKISAIVYCNNLILKELKDKGVNCWIAGGVLRDYLSDRTWSSDCDIFFPNANEFNKAKNYLKSKGARTIYESDKGVKVIYKNNTFDLAKVFFNNPMDTINKSDFTATMFATDGNRIYYGENSFRDLQDGKIVINKISNPTSTFKRVLKHFKKGFSMSSNETEKLYSSLNNLSSEESRGLLNATGTSADYLTNTSADYLTPIKTEVKTDLKTTPETNNFIEKNKKYLLISLALVVGYIAFNKFKK